MVFDTDSKKNIVIGQQRLGYKNVWSSQVTSSELTVITFFNDQDFFGIECKAKLVVFSW